MSDLFYLAFSGEKKFSKELKFLFDHFDLLPKDQIDDFRAYLGSPFLVTDSHLLLLFDKLYDCYGTQAAYAQGGTLFKKLYRSTNLAKNGTVFRKQLQALVESVFAFKTHVYLRDRPEETARLRTRALRHHGLDEVYHEAVDRWQEIAEQMPLGVDRVVHQWEAAHAGYFAAEVKKFATAADRLETTMDRFEELTTLVHLLYETEKLTRRGIVNDEAETAVDSSPSGNEALLEFYRRFGVIRAGENFVYADYLAVRAHFEQWQTTFSKVQRYYTWQLLSNYIYYHCRHHDPALQTEMMWLLRYQVRYDLLSVFVRLPKSLFLNGVSIAAINGEFAFCRTLIDRYSERLAAWERTSALTHAEATPAFYQKDYRRVVDILTENFGKYQMDVYLDALRLKSFLLRSLLCLFAKSQDVEAFTAAKNDFYTYLHRRKKHIQIEHLDHFTKFLNCIQAIFLAQKNRDLSAEKKEELLAMLEANYPLHAYAWLKAYLASA